MSPARPCSRPARRSRVVDDLTFTLALRDSFGLVLEALSKPTANALFVMPEAVARTPASAQIASAVGSGLRDVALAGIPADQKALLALRQLVQFQIEAELAPGVVGAV
jgi:hypothetical protein